MYGVKQGIKAPGEFSALDIAGLGISGSAGILAAIITDFQQKGDTAALFKISDWVADYGALINAPGVPLWGIVLALTVIGAGSVFYFQPITRQGAFAQGFGVLAVLLTMTPPSVENGVNTIAFLPNSSFAQSAAYQDARFVNAAYTPGSVQLIQAQAVTPAEQYNVELKVDFPGGLPADVELMIQRGQLRGRIHNADTNETYNLFRNGGAGILKRDKDTLYISAGVPASAQTATLWVRIECPKHAIKEQSAIATLGQPLAWNIVMDQSSMPLFVQRLGHTYSF